MGILSFIGQMSAANAANKNAELDRRARLAEIEAAKNSRIAEINAQLEGTRKQSDITTVANQHMLRQAIGRVIDAENRTSIPGKFALDPTERNRRVEEQFARTIAMEPMMNSAMNEYQQKQYLGSMPYAEKTGEHKALANLQNIDATMAEEMNRESSALGRMPHVKKLSEGEELNKLADVEFQSSYMKGKKPAAFNLGQGQAANDLSALAAQTAKNSYTVDETQKVDPGLGAEATNAANKAAIAEAALPAATGGLIGGRVPVDPYGPVALGLREYMMRNPQVLSNMLSSVMGNIKAAPPRTNTQLPARGPLFNINELGK